MAHGGYGKRRVTGRGNLSSGERSTGSRGNLRAKGTHGARKAVDNKKSKIVSIKNQIRSIERLLKKPLLAEEVKDAQEKRLEDLKKQAQQHAHSELERKMALRYRKVKFFERRKVERRIRRAEKQLRTLGDPSMPEGRMLMDQLQQLRDDLEYVKFFPKTEKYVALFSGNDGDEASKRNELRKRIKANISAAAAAGVDLEETGSEDEAMDLSDDDFFMAGSSSDDMDADDELTDKKSKNEVLNRLGDGDNIPKHDLPPIARVSSTKRPSNLRAADKQSDPVYSTSGGRSKDEKPTSSEHARRSRSQKGKAAKIIPSTSGGGSSRSQSGATNARRMSIGAGGRTSFGAGSSRHRLHPASGRPSSAAAGNVRKPNNRAGRGQTHHSSVSDDTTKGRSSVTSSYSLEDNQLPKKRKRTRPKKRK